MHRVIAERAKTEKDSRQAADSSRPWTDYAVTNRLSGKTLPGRPPGTEGMAILLVP